jgi:hypothetical protein
MTEDFPEDPFELKLPGLENAPEDLQRFVRNLADAKYDYSALLHQQSLRELRAAVGALNEDQIRAALLRAIMVSIHRHMVEQMHDPQRFALWLQAP